MTICSYKTFIILYALVFIGFCYETYLMPFRFKKDSMPNQSMYVAKGLTP